MFTTRDIFMTALVGCVLALGFVAWQQHQALQHLESDFHTHDESPSAVAERKDGVLLGGLRAEETGRLPVPVRAQIADRVNPVSSRQLEGIVQMLDDPRFLQAVASHQRSMLDVRFGELFGRLELTDDELESLRELLIEKQNAAMDVLMVSRGQLDGQLGGRTCARRRGGRGERSIN